MKWDQIENKWAAMTRRVRADWSTDRSGIETLAVSAAAPDRKKSGMTDDQQAGTAIDRRLHMSIE